MEFFELQIETHCPSLSAPARVSMSKPTVVLNHMDKGKTKWNRYREILASKDIKKNYNVKNNVERKEVLLRQK